MLSSSISLVQTVTCPSSVPSSATKTTEKCSFAESSSTFTPGGVGGPVSNSFYYLYWLPFYVATVRKVDAAGSQSWMASFSFWPVQKSLSVDAVEQSVYLASKTNPIVVLRLSATDGSIVSQRML